MAAIGGEATYDFEAHIGNGCAVVLVRMSYEFDFADVFAAWPELLQGLINSLVLSALAMAIGMVVSVAGARGKVVYETGDLEHGIWSAGTVMGLIRDIPTCKDLVERIVREAEETIRGRLAKAVA
jgi:ABC-type amino acid transport system permease subunit